MVEVTTAIVIERTVATVAAFAGDPGNAAAWFAGTEHVEWHTPPPAKAGSRFTLELPSMRCEYEVTELMPDASMTIHTDDGPFPLDVTFTWEPHGDDGRSTLMVVRTVAHVTGPRRAIKGVIAAATRRSSMRDLADLKGLLERD